MLRLEHFAELLSYERTLHRILSTAYCSGSRSLLSLAHYTLYLHSLKAECLPSVFQDVQTRRFEQQTRRRHFNVPALQQTYHSIITSRVVHRVSPGFSRCDIQPDNLRNNSRLAVFKYITCSYFTRSSTT